MQQNEEQREACADDFKRFVYQLVPKVGEKIRLPYVSELRNHKSKDHRLGGDTNVTVSADGSTITTGFHNGSRTTVTTNDDGRTMTATTKMTWLVTARMQQDGKQEEEDEEDKEDDQQEACSWVLTTLAADGTITLTNTSRVNAYESTTTTKRSDDGTTMTVVGVDGSTVTTKVNDDNSITTSSADGLSSTVGAYGRTMTAVGSDGSTTTTVVNLDGSVTVTEPDGNRQVFNAETNADGGTVATLADGHLLQVQGLLLLAKEEILPNNEGGSIVQELCVSTGRPSPEKGLLSLVPLQTEPCVNGHRARKMDLLPILKLGGRDPATTLKKLEGFLETVTDGGKTHEKSGCWQRRRLVLLRELGLTVTLHAFSPSGSNISDTLAHSIDATMVLLRHIELACDKEAGSTVTCFRLLSENASKNAVKVDPCRPSVRQALGIIAVDGLEQERKGGRKGRKEREQQEMLAERVVFQCKRNATRTIKLNPRRLAPLESLHALMLDHNAHGRYSLSQECQKLLHKYEQTKSGKERKKWIDEEKDGNENWFITDSKNKTNAKTVDNTTLQRGFYTEGSIFKPRQNFAEYFFEKDSIELHPQPLLLLHPKVAPGKGGGKAADTKMIAEVEPLPPQVLFTIPTLSRSLFLALETFPHPRMMRLWRIDRHWQTCLLPKLEQRISYSPHNRSCSTGGTHRWRKLAIDALTHSSFAESTVYPQGRYRKHMGDTQAELLRNDGVESLCGVDYQKLEKIGDAVVHVCVMWELFRSHPEMTGTELAATTSALSTNDALRKRARLRDLREFIRYVGEAAHQESKGADEIDGVSNSTGWFDPGGGGACAACAGCKLKDVKDQCENEGGAHPLNDEGGAHPSSEIYKKMKADVVEALMAAVCIHGGLRSAMVTSRKLELHLQDGEQPREDNQPSEDEAVGPEAMQETQDGSGGGGEEGGGAGGRGAPCYQGGEGRPIKEPLRAIIARHFLSKGSGSDGEERARKQHQCGRLERMGSTVRKLFPIFFYGTIPEARFAG
jgi:dsRNA-specific ribonuclease